MKIAEVVKRDIPILEYAQYKGYEVKRVGHDEYTLKVHDSIRIDSARNLCYRHTTGEGGSIIDFEMMLEHVDAHQALSNLREYLLGRKPYLEAQINEAAATITPARNGNTEKKELRLPEAVQGRYNRVFAYLNKTRGIDKEIISDFIHRNMLYEDKNHNCIFVGYDRDNNAAYAMRHGTLTEKSFKGDIGGSRKNVGWYVDNKSPALFVSEAVIDSMSIMTLLKMNDIDPKKYNYLSLGGISEKALLYHLKGSPVNRVYLALDNDEAGAQGKSRIREALKESGFQGKVINKTPLNKDFNDDLRSLRQAGQIRRQIQTVKSNAHMERGL